MRAALLAIVVGLAVVAAAQAASSESITIAVAPDAHGPFVVQGRLESGREGVPIRIATKSCADGYWVYPQAFENVNSGLGIETGPGGRWSGNFWATMVTIGHLSVRAEVWGTNVRSRVAVVPFHAQVRLGGVRNETKLARGEALFASLIAPGGRQTGRVLRLERLTDDHGWVLVRWLTVKRKLERAYSQYVTAAFRPSVPAGTQLRAVLPRTFTGKCLFAGYSNVVEIP